MYHKCHKFLFKTYEIENTTSYKYLGILFLSSGTFSHYQNDLYKRALRAHIKLQKCLGDIKPNINILLHLFDHTVKPILTYGCEIWGTLNQTCSIFKTNKDYKIEKIG